jgi:hypothetical protein
MPLIPYMTTRRSPVQSQILRPNLRSLASLVIVLVAAAVLAVVLLTSYWPDAIVRSPSATPAVQTVGPAAPTVDPNPDSSLPICRRQGGPTC